IDLKQPLKKGAIVRFKDKNLRVHFKYERLPTFCFICGTVGHQLKDCDAVGDLSEEGFEELEEQDISIGVWLRASSLPRVPDEQKKKDSTSSSCRKSLFNTPSGQSRCEARAKGKQIDEGEVDQEKGKKKPEEVPAVSPPVLANASGGNLLEINAVAESFGAVDISNMGSGKELSSKAQGGKRKKWTRKKPIRKSPSSQAAKIDMEVGKRNLVDIMVVDGTIGGWGSGEKKLKGQDVSHASHENEPEVVLKSQHRLQQ
ncbi:hypothetical protein A2U01_0028584, partial [Trifolium medium]|nr:hypothetical protein [Trifolium medium]